MVRLRPQGNAGGSTHLPNHTSPHLNLHDPSSTQQKPDPRSTHAKSHSHPSTPLKSHTPGATPLKSHTHGSTHLKSHTPGSTPLKSHTHGATPLKSHTSSSAHLKSHTHGSTHLKNHSPGTKPRKPRSKPLKPHDPLLRDEEGRVQVYVSVQKNSGHFHRFTPVHGSQGVKVRIAEGGVRRKRDEVDKATVGSVCERDEVGRSWPPSDSLCLLLCCRRGPQDEPEEMWGSRDGAAWHRREQPPLPCDVTNLGESRGAGSHMLPAHCDVMFS
ncbi:hypothetical protein Pmani_019267 [Petrolisthes manimaculis]|uniref:Uncharacterized protein n=1 Tax=Petrolisthes manimaculis TaxID=1843537 RepID=A0AAE1PI28_9EUCA|nr:hypothetical protein Pmani_019267 [Petrolisthes manimaculis]